MGHVFSRGAALAAVLLLQVACGDDGDPAGPSGSGASGSGGEASGGAGTGGGGGGCVDCPVEHVWSRRFGGPGDDTAAASFDAAGGALVACRFRGTVDLDGHELVAANAADGERDGCVVRLDAEGGAAWAHAFGATATGSMFAAPVTDAAGNILAATTFAGFVALGDEPLASNGGLDVGLLTLSNDGMVLSGTFGAAGDQHIISTAASPSALLATGGFEGSLDSLQSEGAVDVWVGSFVDGQPAWLRSFGSVGLEGAYDIAPTPDGGLVIIGGFEGTLDFGGRPLVSAGSFDGFLVKLDGAGNHVWSKRFGDAEGFIYLAMDVDQETGDVAVVLGTKQTVDFGGGPLPASGGFDVVVARLDAAGAHLWSKRWNDTGEQSGVAIAATASATVVAGDFQGSLDAGGGAMHSAGGSDVFVVGLDGDGNHVWSKRFGDGANQALTSVVIDGQGRVLLAGAFAGVVDLGGGPLESAGGTDMFVALLAP